MKKSVIDLLEIRADCVFQIDWTYTITNTQFWIAIACIIFFWLKVKFFRWPIIFPAILWCVLHKRETPKAFAIAFAAFIACMVLSKITGNIREENKRHRVMESFKSRRP
ncbi:MAG: hypothetical protein JWO73_823 [Candidatus Taylorbacteria bacterium]|nr:hypothetical protein [Candidatus Taylorbacteria bacterium]